MAEIIRELRAKPIGEDELARAKAPLAEDYANLLKRNSGWLLLVDRAQSEADRLERFTRMPERLAKVTAADVQALAQRYLDWDKAVRIVVLPKDAPAP